MHEPNGDDVLDSFRGMDDDEADGDLFQQEEFDDFKNLDEVDRFESDANTANEDDDKRPKKFKSFQNSLLSTDEQPTCFLLCLAIRD